MRVPGGRLRPSHSRGGLLGTTTTIDGSNYDAFPRLPWLTLWLLNSLNFAWINRRTIANSIAVEIPNMSMPFAASRGASNLHEGDMRFSESPSVV